MTRLRLHLAMNTDQVDVRASPSAMSTTSEIMASAPNLFVSVNK